MESPLYTAIERKETASNKQHNNKLDAATVAADNNKMNSSNNSTLEDTSPSDSGVQMLDSECSELMGESITSQNGFEFEDSKPVIEAQLAPMKQEVPVAAAVPKETLVDTNSNVTSLTAEEMMTTSACSTFDTTENIVYRRKVRKTPAAQKAPKKRVSFHEDILKNTRTDNIHIEHGFITYKNGRKLTQHVGAAGRYSWCAAGDGTAAAPQQLCAQTHEDDNGGGSGKATHDAASGRRYVVYRNACSDVLDYGNSDIYDVNESKCLQYDNSGVFEYNAKARISANEAANDAIKRNEAAQVLYQCSCSSSNSSLDSDEQDKNSNRQQYGQAKSSSCDCIGMSNANNNFIDDNCYFSEPNIEQLNENKQKKSVWNKEKQPKSSCLKKTKRHTNIIHEQDLNTKMKKFNVHDMNQLFDNSSKMLFGSLKSIFTMPLPERGVPEGSEDLQAVIECVPELEQTPEHRAKQQADENKDQRAASPPLKAKPFLSKSLDGSKQQASVKKFVHNVDEQLRHKNDETMFAPTRQNSTEKEAKEAAQQKLQRQAEFEDETPPQAEPKQFRNKFIINCESTVFEHTGVSYCYGTNAFAAPQMDGAIDNANKQLTPAAAQIRGSAFTAAPLTKTFTNFFRSLKENAATPTAAVAAAINKKDDAMQFETEKAQQEATDSYFAMKMHKKPNTTATTLDDYNTTNKLPTANSPTTLSELTMSTCTNSSSSAAAMLPQQKSNYSLASSGAGSFSNSTSNSLAIGQDLRGNLDKQSRHLPSPLKKRTTTTSGAGNYALQPQQRYGASVANNDNALLSPDLFNAAGNYVAARGGSGRDSKSTILSEEFDDILTITTDNDKNESDIVIVDYAELNDHQSCDYANLLKPPQAPAAKTSLINRFLRNVTQKKILETSIRQNNFFADKLRNEKKLFGENLYVRGVRPRNFELIDDLNAEIAMEIEMSGVNSPRRELASIEAREMPGDVSQFELGIGEISIEIFNGNYTHILRDASEQLMKVFKLYTGYSREGFMTPVLVFLTDRTLYVIDLVRNRLCTKFVLAYVDLDVILLGPSGNTVLLSNSARDMQQVLLAGGPYPAAGLVANLELCARRSGSILPAVGQLTLAHLAPLQAFVRENSRTLDKRETWMYYAVVNVPAGILGSEQEPLGPHVKGFLMHRRVQEHGATNAKQTWNPGYFLLKAGVLYMFNDSCQKLPSWAMALAECQGARRAVKAGRPHCFEIMLQRELLQLAAPDEYVASEWLQALLQSASGLFEMQEKHKTHGCTLVVTEHHLLTLREDFTAPLRPLTKSITHLEDITSSSLPINATTTTKQNIYENLAGTFVDAGSVLSSAMSTPTKANNTQRSCSSVNSTPTKMSQLSRSTTGHSSNTYNSNTTSTTTTTHNKQAHASAGESYSHMCSLYGKNSGIEILTCADIKEMTGLKIPSHNDTWWCILEFSCQEVRESTDDLIIFFASSSEMQRFLRLLEQLWQAKNNDLFPISVLDEDDLIAEQCTMLYLDINRAWEPLLTAALGYPL